MIGLNLSIDADDLISLFKVKLSISIKSLNFGTIQELAL